MAAMRKEYFSQAWNLFELVITSVGITDVILIETEAINYDLDLIETVVIMKIVRMLRILRLLKVKQIMLIQIPSDCFTEYGLNSAYEAYSNHFRLGLFCLFSGNPGGLNSGPCTCKVGSLLKSHPQVIVSFLNNIINR
jgi:hypothetical protein